MKKTLVIIPGWGGTAESWKDFLGLAQQDFEVHFIEMPFFGSGIIPESVWGVENYAQYVNEKISALDEPFLLGHSFGGQIAVNMAANNPEKYSKLILSGAAAIRPKYTVKRILFGFLAKIGKMVFSLPFLARFEKTARKVLYKTADSPDYDKTSGIKREIFQKIIRESQADLLPKISIPTLVVWGSRDSYVPLARGKQIAKLIPSAEMKIIRDGRHGLHINDTQEFLSIIKEFLEK
ncbi:MAG: hypothetical protein ACD_9C00180G0001 [uncultured bacterium]|nr:MAG: hypothetical protein ACD_9C00180G0001 [uncultured bacterium]